MYMAKKNKYEFFGFVSDLHVCLSFCTDLLLAYSSKI